MAQTIYTMESANIICGDVVGAAGPMPGESTHLVLSELKLPTIEENYVDHTPGGAMVGIEIPSHINKLEATFNLAGWDPEIMAFIGRNDPYYQRFTAYGLIRDRRSSEALQSVARIEGRLGRVNPTAFSKGNLQHHEYSIKSIVSYSLWMQLEPGNDAPTEIYYWDFFTSRLRVRSDEISDDLHRLLGIA
jgi:phage tail tube protein FII